MKIAIRLEIIFFYLMLKKSSDSSSYRNRTELWNFQFEYLIMTSIWLLWYVLPYVIKTGSYSVFGKRKYVLETRIHLLLETQITVYVVLHPWNSRIFCLLLKYHKIKVCIMYRWTKRKKKSLYTYIHFKGQITKGKKRGILIRLEITSLFFC